MKFKRRKLEITPPYVSMADIAFNLVLFFLIMAKTQDNSDLEWEPAKDTGAKTIQNAKVSITVDKHGKTYLNNSREPVGQRDLADRVTQELGDKPPPDRIVLLKIHKDTLASTFQPIMEAVSQAGGEVVHVIEEERP
ncbi:MAG: Biopolymer transport protein ExbD/TolR [Gemmataceae bacterium]|nr:Biopolymer transport protein ExbD/TolR [Gemmataceae bacterium]